MAAINLKVNIKKITKGSNQIQSIELPCEDTITKVGDLLRWVVTYCVGQYNDRKDQGDLLKILSREQIADGAEIGKVGFGVNYGMKKASLASAIEDALQCFEDGIVILFVDKEKKTKLSEEVRLQFGTELTFVKLTMFSGRMW